jgi:single-stranded-DNA-specific exonuclease
VQKILTAKINGINMEDDSEIIDSILDGRNITDVGSFLRPTEEDLIPFEKLKGVEKAAQVIVDAIDNDETFMIYFDNDLDGTTAGSIAYRYLKNYTDNVYTYIADGKVHGLDGLPLDVLGGVDILWIVDSINDNPELYKAILDQHTKIVVTDHHKIPQSLIDSGVDIHLVSSANDYPNPDLTGAGVTWRLCNVIDYLSLNDYSEELYDLCCAGIIGDMGSLESNENRYLCHKGLSTLRNPAIKKLIGSYFFDAQSVQFSVAPAVNSLVRTNNNETAMRIFMTDDEDEIDELVQSAKDAKEEQNSMVDEIIDELLQQGETQADKKCKVFWITEEYKNLSGLLGNRLLSLYSTPLLIVRENGDLVTGSMRACGLQDFAAMVNETNLATCSGHELAAGFECKRELFERFLTVIEDKLSTIEFKTEIEADIEIKPSQVSDYLIKQLGALNRISGSGFKPITVLVRSNDYTVGCMSKGKHLKITDNETGMIFVKWNDGSYKDIPPEGELIGVGTLSTAYYGRTRYTQCVMNDYVVNTTK